MSVDVEGPWTRDCLDPWNSVDVREDGTIAPCCRRPGIGTVAEGLENVRQGEAFRAVRAGLLSGDLDEHCKKCDPIDRIPLETLEDRLVRLTPVPDDRPTALEYARLTLTTACNLRCVYCAVSLAHYKSEEMKADLREKIVADLRPHPECVLVINGHGETTSIPGWADLSRKMLDRGHRLQMTSNFARIFDAEEIEVLSRFRTLIVSLDPGQPALVRAVRRRVDFGTIVSNVLRVRAAALVRGDQAPELAFSSGVYDVNAGDIEMHAGVAVALGVRHVFFWNLVKLPDIPGELSVSPLRTKAPGALVPVVRALQKSVELLSRHYVVCHLALSFVDELEARVREDAAAWAEAEEAFRSIRVLLLTNPDIPDLMRELTSVFTPNLKLVEALVQRDTLTMNVKAVLPGLQKDFLLKAAVMQEILLAQSMVARVMLAYRRGTARAIRPGSRLERLYRRAMSVLKPGA